VYLDRSLGTLRSGAETNQRGNRFPAMFLHPVCIREGRKPT
jgi:hypothetical protein